MLIQTGWEKGDKAKGIRQTNPLVSFHADLFLHALWFRLFSFLLFTGRNICLITMWDGRGKKEQIWIQLPFFGSSCSCISPAEISTHLVLTEPACGDLTCVTGPAHRLHIALGTRWRSSPASWESSSQHHGAYIKAFKKSSIPECCLTAHLGSWKISFATDFGGCLA